ncbi:MAG: hypothetical protein V3T51_04845 [Gammaproteobacteria bacterium]
MSKTPRACLFRNSRRTDPEDKLRSGKYLLLDDFRFFNQDATASGGDS